jgi:16S rRNA (guanine(966)-N(2))-methyltransferase RsmD
MRIISGKLKGRRFEMPSTGWKTRPTTDIAREGLFNILQHSIDLEDIVVLDLFAGSGSVGYEFISRAAQKVIFVEKFAGCIHFIKNNLQLFESAQQAELVKSDVFQYLLKATVEHFDIIFADPPYADHEMMKIPDIVFEKNLLKKDGLLIIEHDDRHNFEKHSNFAFSRKYGQSQFSFFKTTNQNPE